MTFDLYQVRAVSSESFVSPAQQAPNLSPGFVLTFIKSQLWDPKQLLLDHVHILHGPSDSVQFGENGPAPFLAISATLGLPLLTHLVTQGTRRRSNDGINNTSKDLVYALTTVNNRLCV